MEGSNISEMSNESLLADAKVRFGESGLKQRFEKMLTGGREFYGPQGRATDEAVEIIFGEMPRSELGGRLMEKELRAVLIVHNEVRVLWKKISKGSALDLTQIREKVGLSEDELLPEIVVGMAEFIYDLGLVSAVREMSTTKEQEIQYWRVRFSQLIDDDEGFLGRSVTLKLVDVVKSLLSRNVYDYEKISRWYDRCRGVELAAELYLHLFEENLERVEK